MSSNISTSSFEFTGANGKASGFLARPEGARSAPGLILIQEWWGLNDHIKDIAQRFAREGFITAAVDMYDGVTTKNPEEAARLMGELKPETALARIEAAREFLLSIPEVTKIGITGFCMGGVYSILGACRFNFAAAVPFYGIPENLSEIATLTCPMLMIGGEKDQWINIEKMNALRSAMKDHAKDGEVLVYAGADHAFFNDTRPEVYSPADAENAWEKTIEFFGRHLK